MSTDSATQLTTRDLPLAIVTALLALMTVAPLLAWVYGLGRFSQWFLLVTLPSFVALAGIVVYASRAPRQARLRRALALGTLGGLVGTVGYDLVRVPLLLFGLRVLAPIESYGILLLDASSSNPFTGLAGWGYHFVNGICFGIAYAVLFLGRRWWWALVWAMVLETATVVTPFAAAYGLSGKWGLIALAYAAHIPYGMALGWFTERPEEVDRRLGGHSSRYALAAVGAVAVFLVVWHRPWPPYETTDAATISDGRLVPRWLRVPVGGCADITNDDDRSYEIDGADGTPQIGAGATVTVCFSDDGVHRLKLSGTGFTGGFVIVDPELSGAQSP